MTGCTGVSASTASTTASASIFSACATSASLSSPSPAIIAGYSGWPKRFPLTIRARDISGSICSWAEKGIIIRSGAPELSRWVLDRIRARRLPYLSVTHGPITQVARIIRMVPLRISSVKIPSRTPTITAARVAAAWLTLRPNRTPVSSFENPRILPLKTAARNFVTKPAATM